MTKAEFMDSILEATEKVWGRQMVGLDSVIKIADQLFEECEGRRTDKNTQIKELEDRLQQVINDHKEVISGYRQTVNDLERQGTMMGKKLEVASHSIFARDKSIRNLQHHTARLERALIEMECGISRQAVEELLQALQNGGPDKDMDNSYKAGYNTRSYHLIKAVKRILAGEMPWPQPDKVTSVEEVDERLGESHPAPWEEGINDTGLKPFVDNPRLSPLEILQVRRIIAELTSRPPKFEKEGAR